MIHPRAREYEVLFEKALAEEMNQPKLPVDLDTIKFSNYWNTAEYWGIWWQTFESQKFSHCTVFSLDRGWSDKTVSWNEVSRRLDSLFPGGWRNDWDCTLLQVQPYGKVISAVYCNDEHWEIIDRLVNGECSSLSQYVIARDKKPIKKEE